MAKLTNRFLKRACRIASEASEVQSQLTAMFEERYGTTYSDAGADDIIDVLDYGGGTLTLEECDRIMTDAGYPPLSTPSTGAQDSASQAEA
jgi:hypothetical protein